VAANTLKASVWLLLIVAGELKLLNFRLLLSERLLKKDEDDADGEATDDCFGESFKSTVELMEYSVPCLDKAFPSSAPRTLGERNIFFLLCFCSISAEFLPPASNEQLMKQRNH